MSKKNFGIESHLFRNSHFDRTNKFVEAHSYHFTLLDSHNDNVTDTDDDGYLVADIDPDTLIRIRRYKLKNGKAPGIDNVYNEGGRGQLAQILGRYVPQQNQKVDP